MKQWTIAPAQDEYLAAIQRLVDLNEKQGLANGAAAMSIGETTDSVAKVKEIVEDVREASRQQTQGIEQVARAIAQMEKVTQTTAATAEESAAASEELNAQAETAMQVVRGLETLVGGAARSHAVVTETHDAGIAFQKAA